MTNQPPHPGLTYCAHWRCWLSPQACAARWRAANRGRRRSGLIEGTFSPTCYDTYCGRCEVGRERAEREDAMKKAKNQQPPPITAKPPPPPAPAPGLRFSWLDLLGEPLVEDFLKDAKENGRSPAEHLRHVVKEYLYLCEMGA